MNSFSGEAGSLLFEHGADGLLDESHEVLPRSERRVDDGQDAGGSLPEGVDMVRHDGVEVDAVPFLQAMLILPVADLDPAAEHVHELLAFVGGQREGLVRARAGCR